VVEWRRRSDGPCLAAWTSTEEEVRVSYDIVAKGAHAELRGEPQICHESHEFTRNVNVLRVIQQRLWTAQDLDGLRNLYRAI